MNTHCGHAPQYIVQPDGEKAYCALCEINELRAEIVRVRREANSLLDDHYERAYVASDGEHTSCNCSVCIFARGIAR